MSNKSEVFLIGGGGLGDQLLAYSELYNEYGDEIKEVDCVYRRIYYPVPIKEFWESQGVKCSVIYEKWLAVKCNINYLQDEGFYGKYKQFWGKWRGTPCPFPPIKFNYVPNVDIVLNIASGRPKALRQFDYDDIIKFIERYKDRRIYLVGQSNLEIPTYPNVINAINNTTLKEYMNLICSSNIVITQGGFCSFLSGMTKKKIFMVPEIGISESQINELWNITKINSLDDVEL